MRPFILCLLLVACCPQPSKYAVVRAYKKGSTTTSASDFWTMVDKIETAEDGSHTLYLRNGRVVEIPNEFVLVKEQR